MGLDKKINVSGDDEYNEEELEKQFEEIKRRFVRGLPDRLMSASAALPQVEGDGEAAADAVARLYHSVHNICGIAPMVGFAAIGDAARRIDNALVAAFRAKRGLGSGEVSGLADLVEALQAASLVIDNCEPV